MLALDIGEQFQGLWIAGMDDGKHHVDRVCAA